MPSEIGSNVEQREQIAHALAKVLADSYTLYLKTQKFHWNVTGPYFYSLHLMFEQQYSDLALAVDEIAERIRALGCKAPGSYTEFLQLAVIKESLSPLSAKEMVLELAKDHQLVSHTLQAVYPSAEEANDQATIDLATQRMRVHEKMAWMLQSVLE